MYFRGIVDNMKKGMSKDEFSEWKKDWYRRIPKCDKFAKYKVERTKFENLFKPNTE